MEAVDGCYEGTQLQHFQICSERIEIFLRMVIQSHRIIHIECVFIEVRRGLATSSSTSSLIKTSRVPQEYLAVVDFVQPNDRLECKTSIEEILGLVRVENLYIVIKNCPRSLRRR